MTEVALQHIHQEWVLQEQLINSLVSQQGFERRAGSEVSLAFNGIVHYDRRFAVDRELLMRFVSTTQPSSWEKLSQHYRSAAEKTLLEQLDRALKSQGLLNVLRKGIKIVPNILITLCYFRPASGLEPKRMAEYKSNILSVMDEVKYSEKSENRIDIVLFINGLPIVTIEAKNLPTGTSFREAEHQYRHDRPPVREPLLTFKRGALVHFALDEDNVSMTTRLQNSKTRFLPFNRGRDKGAGNPDVEGDHRIAYLYKSGEWGDAVFSRQVLLDIVGRFAHLSTNEQGRSLIFPRYHQLDSVRKMLDHAKHHGAGNNYLIQHSAGSGKSNTIGWLAHQAINLHDEEDEPIFNTAIIITNRVVLDRQLQRTVSQFEQTHGVVKKIDGTSRQLKNALLENARLIVTTIQKFSTEHVLELSGQANKKFAVIVDEAHSGQSGASAQSLNEALTRGATSSEDIEELIAHVQKTRGPQPNISFFAFTATPRNVTLERFGVKEADGIPHAFHLYSMRQAIEEKFILDVLKHCMTYRTYYQLRKAVENDPKLRPRVGYKKVANYATLHKETIVRKVEPIVDHFRTHVMHEMNGHAKAMIVTQSREHAYRYYLGLKKYLKDNGFSDLKALVAFSGELHVDGQSTNEHELNGFSETELPNRFDGVKPNGEPFDENYQFLVVAEKYQTGFDQPKLCAMYVDKELSGLQAVQTLSRLNRTHRGKENTYILDFKNKIQDIRESFKPYYDSTELSDISDPNQIYTLESSLSNFGYLNDKEIDEYAEIYFRGPLSVQDRPRLTEKVRPALQRFSSDEDEDDQEKFRQTLKSFIRFYSFISQVINLEDTSLEKLYVYGEFLLRMLPSREIPPEIEITDDMLNLQATRVEKKGEEQATINPGETKKIQPIQEFAGKPHTEEEKKELSEIVRDFNQRHGTEFTERDMIRFEQVNTEILSDDDLRNQMQNNPPDVVYDAFSQAFLSTLIATLRKQQELKDIILSDKHIRNRAINFCFKRALKHVNSPSNNIHTSQPSTDGC
ncbi:MAG: type I restriction endonuclease subunit R [Gammaproteobacteria bacterium]|nr:type I restriction endonuclease subunit R [Gammaproteobacteria bacterium]MYK43525.1 type I restriction endonuclease subunit R [Gammaproteobacteria bacterium]